MTSISEAVRKLVDDDLYLQWRAAEVLSSLFCIFGLITSTIDYETSYSTNRTHDNCLESSNPIHRWLTLSFTLIGIILLYSRHFLKARWYNLNISKFHKTHKRRSRFSLKLVLEILVLLIFPYPGVHGSFTYRQSLNKSISEDFDNTISLCYTYSEFLYLFMFLRLVFLIRTLFNYTPYQDSHARSHCLQYNIKANVRFSVKSMMQAHPQLMIVMSIIPSFFLFGAVLRVFERPFTDVSGKNYESLQNAAWNSFVTMSSIGYGDIFPCTLPGRAVAVVCAMWGAYALSMVVFALRQALELNTNQARALAEIKITRTAGKVICALAEFYVARKKGNDGDDEWDKVEKALKRFRFNILRVKSLKKRIGFKEYIPKHKIKELENKMKDINKMLILAIYNKKKKNIELCQE